MSGLNATFAALRRRQSTLVRAGPKRMHEVADFGANPGALRALIYAPPNRPPNAPLVVALHGCTQDGEGYAESGGWLTLADRYGFVVLCPEQIRANNPNLCFNWFQPGGTARGAGEAASIAQMVRHVLATEALDDGRVFITGLSAGGAMSAVMLAAYPEMFAAGAVIAGLPYGAAFSMPSAFAAMAEAPERSSAAWGDSVRAASRHAGPWPRISIWHGDADVTVRPGAGEALVRQWTNLHGVDQRRPEVSKDHQRTLSVWRSPSGETLVDYHVVRGMGHGAPLCTSGPDGCGFAAPHMLDVGISSSLENARLWGIAKGVGRRPEAVAFDAPPRPQPIPTVAKTRAVDIGAVIASALRDAGLLK